MSVPWVQEQLGDFVILQRGFDITKKEQRPGPYRVISSSGPSSFHDEARVAGPGVVIGRKGSLGGVYFSKSDFWPHDTTLWVKDFKGNEPLFAYYFLKTLGLERFDVGAANPTLNRNHLHLLPVSAPAPPTQRKIAAVLAAYDELIENNLRRIEILEEMAQAVYREWFVSFRFPGHEGVTFVDSPLGLIPEGWDASSVGDVAENFDRLRKPLSKTQRAEMPGEYPYYGAAKVFDHVNDYIFDGEYLLVAEDGSVITPTGFPVLQMATGKFWANNHTHVIQGRMVSTRYLYLALSRLPITGYITGAAQPKVTQGALNRIPVLVPSVPVLSLFEAQVGIAFELRYNLLAQNANLRSTRDLLLPKLVSGEIDVSDLEIETAWLAS